MSELSVTSIASLETLRSAMGQYQEQSLATMQGFATVLSQKVTYLESLENSFVERVRRAESALHSCEIARASDPPEDTRSCSSQEAALARAEANYARYKSIMAQVRQARSKYDASEGDHKRNLQHIASSTLPKFTEIINDMRTYRQDLI